MLVLTMPVIILVFLACIGYIVFTLRDRAIQDNEKLAFSYVENVANEVKARLNEDIGLSRAIASAVIPYKDSAEHVRDAFVEGMLSGIINTGDRYHSAWLSLELNHFDPSWDKPYGRKRFTFYHTGEPAIDFANLEGDLRGSSYLRLKQTGKEEVNDPYYYTKYSDAGDARNDVFGTSICAPVLIDGKFAGVGGVDMSLESFGYVSGLKPFDESRIFLLSNNGTFVAHPDKEFIGKKMEAMVSEEVVDEHLLDLRVKEGESYLTTMLLEEDGPEYLLALAPIELGNSDFPWAIAILVPKHIILSEVNRSLLQSLLIAALGMGIVAFVLWKIADNITGPLSKVNALIKDIAHGDIDLKKKVEDPSKDEVGEISVSANMLIDNLNSKVEFARSIGEGKLNLQHQVAGDQDILGQSLISMRDSLKEARMEEEKRSWSNRGLAKFTEILRLNDEDIEVFYLRVVSEMVKYLEVNQGGLFVLNDDDEKDIHLELVAAYAYERRKFIEKKVGLQHGLVGQCYREKEKIILKELPEDYIHITSGLGLAPPAHLIVVPVKLEDTVLSVMEFASFHVVEDYKIEFIEKIAENLAATISALKTNQRTRVLLEQSQQQAEELKSQEEEMRQNMEEMEATQEEMRRTQRLVDQHQMLMDVLLNQAGDSVIVFDQQYRIVLINDVLKRRYAGTDFQMDVGENLLEKLGAHREKWERHYQKVLAGQTLRFIIKSQLDEAENYRFYFMSPIRGAGGEVLYASVITRDANESQYTDVLSPEEFESM